MENKEKIKVLWLSDFNTVTGFSQVAHNIMEQLQKTGAYEFDVIGINHFGEPYDHEKWNFPIYPARDIRRISDPRYADLYGRQRLLDMLGTGKYDILFTLQDSFILESVARQIVETRKELHKERSKTFKWIFYYPIDSDARDNWITDCVALADFPVVYTQFGKRITQRYSPNLEPQVIYHGINLKDFFPLPPEDIKDFRHDFFEGKADGKFVITNINRNQPRKDIAKTIEAFAKFKLVRPDSLLYLHMKREDVGGDVADMARSFGLVSGKDFVVPKKFTEHSGYPIKIVNYIYNASDVVISTTLGEGWGLSSTEAMAAKVPVIMPNHTSLSEICAEGRGILVEAGKSSVCLGAGDMNQYRPLTDVDSLVSALVELYDDKERNKEAVEKAYLWVKGLSWDVIGKEWARVFETASTHPLPECSAVGRNEPCPTCGVKWKKCKVHNPDLSLMKA